MKKRLFAFFLCFMMLFSLLPTSVLAASHSSTVDINTLAAGDTIAVGTEITGLANGLSVLYFSCDEGFFVDKSYSGASCTVEGAVVNSSNTANIGAPENGFWKVTSVNAAASTLSLISTDQVYPPLYFYTYDPFVLEITISTNPTNKWPTGMTKDGYSWYGWSLLDGTAVTESYAQTSQGYEAIFGRWTNNTTDELFPAIYTVTFDYNDDATAAINRNTSLRGGVLGWPAAPTREGYTFMGWEDANGNTHGSADLFTANTALTAQWTEGTVVPTYNVTFNYNDGETASVTLTTDENGNIINWPADPTRDGYEFIAWADSNGNHKTAGAVFTEATTLTANWRKVSSGTEEQVQVLFFVDGQQVSEHNIPKNSSINPLPSQHKDNYEFLGWATDVNDHGTIIGDDYCFTTDTQLHAVFVESSDDGGGSTEHVTILFFVDGEQIAEHGILKGSPIEEYPNVNKGGFIFLGWATDVNDHNTIVDPSQTFDVDTDLYAVFEEDPNYTPDNDTVQVLFFVDGQQVSEHNIEKGSTINPLPSEHKDNYEFLGWATDVNDHGTIIGDDYCFTTDTHLHAVFVESSDDGGGSTEHVTILFFVDGEQIAEHGILKGSPVEEYPDVNKGGFIFLGWATDVTDHSTIVDPSQTFDVDTDLYAVFEEDPNYTPDNDTVQVLFFVDGEQIAVHGILKGSPIEEYPNVNKGGFIFLGWATDVNDHNTIVDPSQTFDVDTDLYAVFEEEPNAGEAENPVVEMSAAVENGKIIGLPGLGDGLKFMYIALAVGDKLYDEAVSADDLEFLAEDMNSMIGMDITLVTMDQDSHDNTFFNLTDSTVITKDGEFLLVVVATDINADENGDRRIFAIYADIIENTVIAGEIEDTTPSTNTGSAKLDNTITELEAAVPFTEEELEAIENGEDVQIWLEVTDITNSVSDTDKTLVDGKKSTYTVGMYIDASMFKQVGDSSEEKLSELNEKVTITITLPDSLINTNANLFRTYRVIRVHDGIAEIITPTFDEKTNTLTFKTDCFSTYAIAYKDSTVPKTGDNHDLFFWSATLAISAIGFIVANKKRKYN